MHWGGGGLEKREVVGMAGKMQILVHMLAMAADFHPLTSCSWGRRSQLRALVKSSTSPST